MKQSSSVLVLVLLSLLAAPGAELTLKVVTKEPPAALESAIRGRLQSKAVQLLEGAEPVFEFWLASEVPLTAKPESTAKALDVVKTAALLGAVSVAKGQRDYRDDDLPGGVHTVRLAVQQQDGNHLGTAEFLWFAVLVPAKLDTKPDGITDYKTLVKTSSKETSTDHPVILSLRPATEAGSEVKLNVPAADHKSVRVNIPGKTASGETVPVPFEIVYEGKGHK